VEEEEWTRLGLVPLSLLAVIVGIVAGFGALVFRRLIGLVHNLFFAGHLGTNYDANVFTLPSPWGAGIILVPVIGAVLVTLLVTKFAPEARGHGVPEVLDAIYYKEGKIRAAVVVVKSLASAIAIGTGASVGREGPIIQIGSAMGSTLGKIVTMPAGQRITLVAAGAGAGIAATFNTPIGGVMFAIELMMPEVSARTFLPVALATGAATFIGRWTIGDMPAFQVPPLATIPTAGSALATLLLFATLGALTGVAAAGFVKALEYAEDHFERIENPYVRHMLGMLSVGILIYVLMVAFGHYYVEGVGYATIEAILVGGRATFWLLALLFLCKMFATSVSLGSGSSGGIFSPCLFMGATLGGSFALILSALGVPLVLSVPAFAMVGMGAMVGGGTGAVMTAVVMIFEMTRSYDIVMPMIVAVAMSVGVRRVLSRENIYTLKLARRGRVLPKALHANMFLVRRAREVLDTDVLVMPASTTLSEFFQHPGHAGRLRHVVLTRNDRVFGVLRINTGLRRGLETAHTAVTLGEVASRRFILVGENMIVFDVIDRMWRKKATMAVVVAGTGVPRAKNVRGVITKEHIADSVASSVRIYPRD
jgi:CIC family chloride channel protein